MHTDEFLAAQAAKGSLNAFATLVERHSDRIMQLLSKQLPVHAAEDVAQDAFLRAYENLHRFAAEGDGSFKRWLTTIALNRCRDYWRKLGREDRNSISLAQEAVDWLRNALAAEAERQCQELARWQDAREVVFMLLNVLPPDDRMAFVLTYAEGYTQDEVAAAMGWSLSKTKVRIHRARKLLRAVAEDLIVKDVI